MNTVTRHALNRLFSPVNTFALADYASACDVCGDRAVGSRPSKMAWRQLAHLKARHPRRLVRAKAEASVALVRASNNPGDPWAGAR